MLSENTDQGGYRGENIRIFGWHRWAVENPFDYEIKIRIKYSTCVVMLAAHCNSGIAEELVQPHTTGVGQQESHFLAYASYNGVYKIITTTELLSPAKDKSESTSILTVREPPRPEPSNSP